MVRSSRSLGRSIVCAFGAIACLSFAGCSGPDHPDRARYEYLYMDGVFEPPYTAFPQGVERMNWKCYDGKVQREFSCMMIRGGWDQFQYIYRDRK